MATHEKVLCETQQYVKGGKKKSQKEGLTLYSFCQCEDRTHDLPISRRESKPVITVGRLNRWANRQSLQAGLLSGVI